MPKLIAKAFYALFFYYKLYIHPLLGGRHSRLLHIRILKIGAAVYVVRHEAQHAYLFKFHCAVHCANKAEKIGYAFAFLKIKNIVRLPCRHLGADAVAFRRGAQSVRKVFLPRDYFKMIALLGIAHGAAAKECAAQQAAHALVAFGHAFGYFAGLKILVVIIWQAAAINKQLPTPFAGNMHDYAAALQSFLLTGGKRSVKAIQLRR